MYFQGRSNYVPWAWLDYSVVKALVSDPSDVLWPKPVPWAIVSPHISLIWTAVEKSKRNRNFALSSNECGRSGRCEFISNIRSHGSMYNRYWPGPRRSVKKVLSISFIATSLSLDFPMLRQVWSFVPWLAVCTKMILIFDWSIDQRQVFTRSRRTFIRSSVHPNNVVCSSSH